MKNEISKTLAQHLSTKGKNKINIIIEAGKIQFLLNDKKAHEEIFDYDEGFKVENCIKKYDDNYRLNEAFVQILELFNGLIVQIGSQGISIFRNIAEFNRQTKANYTKRNFDFIFYKY